MPIGLRHRLDVVDLDGAMPHFAAGLQIRQENGGGSEVHALSEMADHMPALNPGVNPEVNPGVDPGVVGLEGCESSFSFLKTWKTVYLSGAQLTSEDGDLGDAYRLPETENPADGLAKVRSDMVPLLRLLESGLFPRGAAWQRSGAWGALEFMAHARIRDWAASRWVGLMK